MTFPLHDFISGPPLRKLDIPYYTRAWLARHDPSDYVISPKKKSTSNDESNQDGTPYSSSSLY